MLDSDHRAQSVVIGSLLLFAFAVVGFSVAQATLVPDENAEVEFNHNQAVQDDLVDLRSNVLRSAVTGESRSSTVTLGTRYPSRALFLNPGPPSGSLRTEPAGDVTVENAVATDDEVADYLDGSTVSFPTTAVVYEPSYNEYQQAPTTRFQATVLTNQQDGTTQVRSEQTFVSGRTVTLVPVVGQLGTSQVGSTSVEPAVVSEVERTVTVESDGDPIALRVETRLSEDAWRDLLRGELDSSGHVQSVDCPDASTTTEPCGTLVVTLEPDTEYELRMGEVALGPAPDAADDDDPQYIVPAAGDEATVTEGKTRTVTLEVRDQFNNPVSGVRVRLTQPQAGSVDDGSESNTDGTVTAVTDEDGQVSVTYRAPLNIGADRGTSFEATITSASGLTAEQATSTVSLAVEDGSDTVDDSNWDRPLVNAVQPEPETGHYEFVRVYFPRGVNPTQWSLTDGEATTRLGSETDYTGDAGEHYFVADESAFVSNHGVSSDRVHSLGSIDLGDVDSVRLVRDGRTVDAFGYGNDQDTAETVESRPTEAGWFFDFDSDSASVPAGSVAQRVTEDGGYVDGNTSVDWGRVDESEFFSTGGVPTVESLSASTDYAGRNGNRVTSRRVTFSYSVDDDDGEIADVTFEMEYTGDGTVVGPEPETSNSGSRVLDFGEAKALESNSGDPGDVVVTVTVDDGEGNTRTFEGTIDDAGQTITFERGEFDEV